MKKKDAEKFEACLRELYGESWEYKWRIEEDGFSLVLDVFNDFEERAEHE